jgi:hypothetical protein
MGQIACDPTPIDVGYPPVKLTSLDSVKQAQITFLQNAAPFGRVRGQAQPVSAVQYRLAMEKEQERARALDFRWPFWTALGLGSLGVVVLVARRP